MAYRTDDDSSRALAFLAGVGVGALVMYVLDPDRGSARRTFAGQKAGRYVRDAGDRLSGLTNDARNRMRGARHELRARRREGTPDDDTLIARVRAELGHHVESLRQIEVEADDGRVVLRGQVPALEAPKLLATVRAVRGVQEVQDELRTT